MHKSKGGLYIPASTAVKQASASNIPGPEKVRWEADIDSYRPLRLEPFIIESASDMSFDVSGVLHHWAARNTKDVELSQAQQKTGYYTQAWIRGDRDSYIKSLNRARNILKDYFGFDIVGDKDLWSENWGRK